ncbi:MAG: thermonuclease family protein, partial [Dolichospermum sp.]
EGLAKVYHPYLNKCPSQNILKQAEAEARQQKIGIWGDGKFVNPWNYRQTNK